MKGKILRWSGILILIIGLNVFFNKLIQSCWHTTFSVRVGIPGAILAVMTFFLGALIWEMIKGKYW